MIDPPDLNAAAALAHSFNQIVDIYVADRERRPVSSSGLTEVRPLENSSPCIFLKLLLDKKNF
jgi:hypothetical protein